MSQPSSAAAALGMRKSGTQTNGLPAAMPSAAHGCVPRGDSGWENARHWPQIAEAHQRNHTKGSRLSHLPPHRKVLKSLAWDACLLSPAAIFACPATWYLQKLLFTSAPFMPLQGGPSGLSERLSARLDMLKGCEIKNNSWLWGCIIFSDRSLASFLTTPVSFLGIQQGYIPQLPLQLDVITW